MPEKRVKLYDPGRQAYYDVPISEAKKLVAQLEAAKAEIAKAEASEE